jgi:voltage-gated potassium channel
MSVVAELRGLTIPLVVLSMIYIISIVFFHFVEGWNFLDAAYFTTVTLATVGYGDVHPLTSAGKIGAIVLIFVGVSTTFYVITHLGIIREKTIDPHIQRRIDILRNLTALQTGPVNSSQLKKIKEKISSGKNGNKGAGVGKL